MSVEMAPELTMAWGRSQGSSSRQGCVSDKSLLFPANFYHLFDVFILYGGYGGAALSLGPSFTHSCLFSMPPHCHFSRLLL